MSTKRSNNAIWKLVVPDGVLPKDRIKAVIRAYAEQVTEESGKRRLIAVPLNQLVPDVQLDLYVRRSFSLGLLPFVEGYLAQAGDAEKFHINGADACLFLATKSSLFAVTSGAAYHIIADSVDYSFPFDTAKKLISNKFTATDVRDMTGSKTSRSETYRRTYSIDKSEAMDTVWKKLVGRLDAERLPEDSLLRGIINPDKPPAVEIKSAFVLRQKLDLVDVCKLIEELENLPEPSEEHLRELSFLDNLYPIKNDKELTDDLTSQFVADIRRAMLADEPPDVDLLDPYEIISFKAGSNFMLSRTPIGDSAPDIDELLPVLHGKLKGCLQNEDLFFKEFLKLSLSYRVDPDDTSKTIRRKLLEFLHGQVNLGGKTYFCIDKIWYRSLGDFLENLKRDFIDDVFTSGRPALLGSEVAFLSWTGGSEGKFNEDQAEEAGFYFGDEVFAKTDSGKVELFDLLKVDDENKKLYIIHAKKGFAAKMRDACSQILVSADVISRDLANEKKVLTKYYNEEWSKKELNAGVSEMVFLSWFDYDLIYVVLCSTNKEFVVEDFTKNRLPSHIARREILATKNEMKRNGRNFRLAHTKYEG
jgi:uncharacterized protein (TIGR04141 family)